MPTRRRDRLRDSAAESEMRVAGGPSRVGIADSLPQVDPLEVLPVALGAYDALSGLRVTVHAFDVENADAEAFRPFVPPDRWYHENPFCQAVKDSGYDPVCTEFDQTKLHAEIVATPDGYVKICPAGLAELVVPCVCDERLLCVLFAGIRTPGKDLTASRPLLRIPHSSIGWPSVNRLPPPLSQGEAELRLEGLRQLGARIESWWQKEGQVLAQASHVSGLGRVATRQFLIRRFVRENHLRRVTLAELAEVLHLSESRAAHVVRECCGRSLVDMLTAARIITAARLLRDTELGLLEVALNSGFGDAAHFMRTFKARMGTTPGRYRLLHRRARAELSAETERGAPAGGWVGTRQKPTRS